MVNGRKSLFSWIPYIYNVCLVYRRQVYEEFTEEDGLWHRVKLGFLAEKMYLLHCKDMNFSGKREHLNGRILSF